jgi:hypothetical protein
MNLHERVLGLLAFKYVDEVIISAPYTLTEDIMDELKVSHAKVLRTLVFPSLTTLREVYDEPATPPPPIQPAPTIKLVELDEC